MITGLYSAASGLAVAAHRQDVIAENLAHVNVPGYRGRSMATSSFEAAMAGVPTSVVGHGVAVGEDRTDFTTGPLQHTGRSLDVALNGDGFFEITTPDGPRYTRNGSFFVSSDGELVNAEGYPIAGQGGSINIPADVSIEQLLIGEDGTLRAKGQALGQLRIVSFADNQKLRRAGTTVFEAPNDVTPEDSKAIVVQGAREQSNISAVTELIRLMMGTRNYQAAQKALSTIDQAIEKRINPQTSP